MRKKESFDPRELMERAVEVMRESIDERRGDGKACPKVGAVLLKPDGAVETAYRGELRDGDHAEFTLLERRNRGSKLDGCILFSTLEPCAPGARHPPKLSCAERIVLARIRDVWVGIEDPDPQVDRKGIKYLQDAGVTVHMFDRDLQEVIWDRNQEFFQQALDRAAAAQGAGDREITLTTLEGPSPHTELDDLSAEALESFREALDVADAVGSPAFRRRLVRLGLLKEAGRQFVPTGFGMLLFGNEPRTALPQAGLLGTIRYSGGGEEIRNFEGPQVLAPDGAIQWLREKLPNPIDRSHARRGEANEPFFEMVREGVVNALVHRDYDIAGAKCQLSVTSDTIVIMSPGMPVEPITFEQLQSFSAPMLSRNPVLHYVFARMQMAEERGLGLASMRDRAQQLGLPLPRYERQNPYVALTLYRTESAAVATLPDGVRALMTDSEIRGLQWLATHGRVKAGEYAKAMGIDARTSRRHLSHFVELGLARRLGSARLTEYKVW